MLMDNLVYIHPKNQDKLAECELALTLQGAAWFGMHIGEIYNKPMPGPLHTGMRGGIAMLALWLLLLDATIGYMAIMQLLPVHPNQFDDQMHVT